MPLRFSSSAAQVAAGRHADDLREGVVVVDPCLHLIPPAAIALDRAVACADRHAFQIGVDTGPPKVTRGDWTGQARGINQNLLPDLVGKTSLPSFRRL